MVDIIKKLVLTVACFLIGVACVVSAFVWTDVQSAFTFAVLGVGLLCLVLAVLIWSPIEEWSMNIQEWFEKRGGK